MLSRHLQRRCCDSDPVLLPCWSQKESHGTLKIKEFHETSSKFCGFAVFDSSRLWDPILNPPGLRFESLLALKMPPRPPQERPRHAQGRPRGLQDRPKSAQEASQTFPRGLQDNSKRRSGGQEAPRAFRAALWDTFCLHFGPLTDATQSPTGALRALRDTSETSRGTSGHRIAGRGVRRNARSD